MSAKKCPIIHCWEHCFEADSIGVCLLEIDHDGPHEFTSGEQIRITFREPAPFDPE